MKNNTRGRQEGVTAEYMRGLVAEHIPNALAIAATSLGMSVEEFRAAVEQGQVESGVIETSLFRDIPFVPTTRPTYRYRCSQCIGRQLNGSACVEDWDPEFDPRSTLIEDL